MEGRKGREDQQGKDIDERKEKGGRHNQGWEKDVGKHW